MLDCLLDDDDDDDDNDGDDGDGDNLLLQTCKSNKSTYTHKIYTWHEIPTQLPSPK